MIKRIIRKKVTVFDKDWKILESEVQNWQNEVLMKFCLTKCGGQCCHVEHRKLNEVQIRRIFKLSKRESLYKMKNRYGESFIRKDEDKTFSTRLSYGVWCPSFDKTKKICEIYLDKLRPDYCHNFPFYYTLENDMPVLEIFDCPGTRALDCTRILRVAEKLKIWTRCLVGF